MKIAYLMNTYPMTSTTFIRREIHALEQLGMVINRYAVRRWKETLVDLRDLQEAEQTRYFLSGNVWKLFWAFLQEAFANPSAILRGIATIWEIAPRKLSIKNPAYLLQSVYLLRQARQDGIEHVHTHFATNATAVAMVARIMGGPSYSFTAHGPDEFEDASSLAFKEKLSHASFAIAISHYCKMMLLRFGGPHHAKKIHIVHCGIDTDEFNLPKVGGIDTQIFVCVGRLCPAKGQILIPEAVERLKGEFPGVKVLLVGDGEARSDIQNAIAKFRVQSHIEIKGWLPNNDVRECVAGCRALILPSFAEGLPIVIMEALAMGRPVISTSIAGIPELLDAECGWIIPAGSVEDLVEAMRGALRADPAELTRLGANGRARVVAGFRIQHSAHMLFDHFKALMPSSLGSTTLELSD